MSFDSLCQKIEKLSQQVEQLIDDQDEANCVNLLTQRQALLEQLQQQVERIQDPSSLNLQREKLRSFFLSIQARDKNYTGILKEQTRQLLVKSAKNVQGKKAIKAYRSIL